MGMTEGAGWTDEVAAALAVPFPMDVVELKPTNVMDGRGENAGKKVAIALAYVDARHYQARLDAVVGPGNWATSYRQLWDGCVICSLTILGVTHEDVGEKESNDPNQATSAVAQSFKRACASFGLGRYLYIELEQAWVEVEPAGRGYKINPNAARQAIEKMYRKAGIDLSNAGKYRSRIETLLGGLDETRLVEVGKFISGKLPVPQN